MLLGQQGGPPGGAGSRRTRASRLSGGRGRRSPSWRLRVRAVPGARVRSGHRHLPRADLGADRHGPGARVPGQPDRELRPGRARRPGRRPGRLAHRRSRAGGSSRPPSSGCWWRSVLGRAHRDRGHPALRQGPTPDPHRGHHRHRPAAGVRHPVPARRSSTTTPCRSRRGRSPRSAMEWFPTHLHRRPPADRRRRARSCASGWRCSSAAAGSGWPCAPAPSRPTGPSLLGIPVHRLNTLVWVLASGLSGLAVLLRMPIQGVAIGGVFGLSLLLRALAAAVIGRMENLPVTFGAAIAARACWSRRCSSRPPARWWSTASCSRSSSSALLVQRRGGLERARDLGASSWQAIREVRPIPRELARLREVRAAQAGLVGPGRRRCSCSTRCG